jgi:hypothetical protein
LKLAGFQRFCYAASSSGSSGSSGGRASHHHQFSHQVRVRSTVFAIE